MRNRRVIFEYNDCDRILSAARAGKTALSPKEQLRLIISLKRLTAVRDNMKLANTEIIELVRSEYATREKMH